MSFRYRDRAHAGRELARYMDVYANRTDTLVLALPRGGVEVAYEVATQIHAPLDVCVVRKLGVPGHDELAMGAIAGDGTYVIDKPLIAFAGISREEFDAVVSREVAELKRREMAYRDGRPIQEVRGKAVIVVDDGLATGATMGVAVESLQRHDPRSVTIAVPVGSTEGCAMLRERVNEVVCPYLPEPFQAVALFYGDFAQVSDDEVRRLLTRATLNEVHGWAPL